MLHSLVRFGRRPRRDGVTSVGGQARVGGPVEVVDLSRVGSVSDDGGGTRTFGSTWTVCLVRIAWLSEVGVWLDSASRRSCCFRCSFLFCDLDLSFFSTFELP